LKKKIHVLWAAACIMCMHMCMHNHMLDMHMYTCHVTRKYTACT